MIVPDGRTDPEKLEELLGNPEETHLDLKAKVDLDDPADRLKFIKDAVTMASRPLGGYILIGVDDDGKPCMPTGTIPDRSRFDGSRLGTLIRGYIEASIYVIVQIHDLDDGNEVMLVYVKNPDGLPIPFSKLGQYPGPDGKPVTVFRPGEIFVREGAENVPIRYPHWQDVLSAFAEKIRNDATATAQALLNEVIAARQTSPPGSTDVPLLMGMDESTFAAAMVALLESGNDVRLRQFIRSLGGTAGPSATVEEFTRALDKWTVFCAQALYFERGDLVDEAIEKVCGAYKKLSLDADATRKRLAVVERIYVLGGLAVRLDAWETVNSLVLQPVPSNVHEPGYIYASWIRNAQVYASREELRDDGPDEHGRRRGGFIISAARELMVEHPAMRPDLTDAQLPTEITRDDLALNTLCEFDLAYCFIVDAMGTGHGSAYPSSAAFDEDRAKAIAQRIVADPDARHRLFPNIDDAVVAKAIQAVYEVAVRESANNYGGRWWDMPPSVAAWVSQHLPRP
ncbi:MAG: ATP-binding protein [Mycobacterium sp.]|uniref:AlbA family DNA-binding domain-containing protein n=1 Tax=Mycobacterium sp. TaxID=1785 RepID=UPI001ED337CC|nr:ATP-binding protein [Mycobacterium sp.]MBW0016392.1 ATP-binding protein [Mycobacterium sp.]